MMVEGIVENTTSTRWNDRSQSTTDTSSYDASLVTPGVMMIGVASSSNDLAENGVASQHLVDAAQLSVSVSQLQQSQHTEAGVMMIGVASSSDLAENGVASQHLVDAAQLSVSVSQLQQSQHTEDADTAGSEEPPAKRPHLDEPDINMEQSIKQIAFTINKAICLRLDSIETKLETINKRTQYLEEKVEQIIGCMKQNGNLVIHGGQGKSGSGGVVIGLPQERADAGWMYRDCSDQTLQNLGPNVQLITLNTEEDFPNGTWLGDESNHEMRVRVPITPSDLLHITSNCRTAEKMALSLLDYLFERETLSMSNLSGMGKYGKRQLDPLMIYGIRCHLIYRFGITEHDWHRIKQNIDSKCRTAFRRRVRGLPLTGKSMRGKAPATYVHLAAGNSSMTGPTSDDSIQDDSELQIQGEVDFQAIQAAGTAEILQTAAGEIQVLHATPEQVAQLQQSHQIQILPDGTQVVQLQQGLNQEAIQVALPLGPQDGYQFVRSGDSLQVTEADSDQMDDEHDGLEVVHIIKNEDIQPK